MKYGTQSVWFGFSEDSIIQQYLALYKTGHTNANDGGIDFVMKPIGRFFQVTETIDVNKYFLDIDKINNFPITFVIKSDKSPSSILKIVEKQALQKYKIKSVVDSYLNCIEEIITTESLLEIFNEIIQIGMVKEVMNEIILQSKYEFNMMALENSNENES